MVLDRSDWAWVAGYTVGGILGAVFTIWNGVEGSILAILVGSLAYLFISGVGGR
jgi:hypothetical protein